MPEMLVVAEHREGELREVTLQMLGKATELCASHRLALCGVIIGDDVRKQAGELAAYCDRVVAYSDPRLAHFSAREHAGILAGLLSERAPLLTLMGHTPWSLDLAPALAAKTGFPLATDCVDLLLEEGRPKAVRQIYSGKLFCRVAMKQAAGYLMTVRAGSFAAAAPAARQAEITWAPVPPAPSLPLDREFVAYEDAGAGEVDICQADLLVSVGRGIGDEENIEPARQLAALMGGVLSCSRPVVDKKWLPKYHQVGTSGKTVRPKVYLALGISGAFQHVAGMSGSDTIIAVNRDKKAPIFRVADYGVVADAVAVIAALKARLSAERTS
jgi:electron transfer flavoprotein alpha subunit